MNDWLFPEEVIELIRQKAKELLLDFDTLADAVNRALGIVGYSMQEATEAFEKLFKQAEEQSIASEGVNKMIILLVILAIIAIAGFAITTALRKGLDPKDEYDKDRLKILGIIRGAVIGGCVVIFAIAMLIGSVKIMDQTEVGIVKTFGKVDHTVSGGLNFVNPISDTVEVMDLRVHVNEASFASYTKDAQPLTAAIEYQYEPIAAQAMQIVSQYGSYEILETKLQAAVEERAKIVFARYGAMTLLENRATLSAQVQEEVKELEELFPVNFTQVVVKDIDFSDAFEQAVEAKMQAEQNALRAENEKQEAITRAEQEREVARVEAEAAVLAAEGEARALEITREALENMPDTWIAQQYLEKWDGKLPQFITGDGSGLMLTPNLEQ